MVDNKNTIVLSSNSNIDTSDFKSWEEVLTDWGKYLTYFRWYPDRFIDFVSSPETKFQLYPYQRIYMRVMVRYQYVFITATRGTAKSFTNILIDYIRCILYPKISLALLAPAKNQATKIAKENIENIWNFLPSLKNEIEDHTFAVDYTRLVFFNGSQLDVVGVGEGTRGLRRHGLSFEEIVNMDKHRETIGSVVMPLLANNRIGADGKVSSDEVHKQVKYVTTASNRQSYAWDTLKETMVKMANGESAFIIGNDYELPVLFNQLDLDYIANQYVSASNTTMSFYREYLSIWTGSSENSLVQLSDLQDSRKLKKAEKYRDKNAPKGTIYVIAVDVARSEKKKSATTSLAVIKATPRKNGTYRKQIVNVSTYKGNMIFHDQADWVREMIHLFEADCLVIDSNGLGRGLLDILINPVKKNQQPFGVINDPDYEKYNTKDSKKIIYSVSANTKGTKAGYIHNTFMSYIESHDVELLVDERQIKGDFKTDTTGEVTANELLPHIETSLFVDEVMNLTYSGEGSTTKVKRVSRQIEKDRYSAISYGLFYIYTKEREQKNKKPANTNPEMFSIGRKANYKLFH